MRRKFLSFARTGSIDCGSIWGMKRFDVAGLGQCSIDMLATVAEYPPADVKAETSAFQIQGGGPVATALVAAARLGLTTAFLGKIGGDEYGKLIHQGLTDEGVNLEGLVTAPDKESQTAFIAVERGTGRRTIFWHRGSAFPLEIDELQKDVIRQSRFLHLDGLHIQASIEAAKIARRMKIPVMLDSGTYRPEIEPLLPMIDYLVVGKGFAFSFLNTKDPVEALQELATYGARMVCITLGEEGCVAAANGVLFRQRAWKISPVVDTTGCGDAFHGGLIYALTKQWPIQTCLGFAAAVAALKCRALGGRAALPTLAEAMSWLPKRLHPPA